MSLLLETILRLRTACPAFDKRIGGAAAYEAANIPGTDLALPFAFVVPVADEAEDVSGNVVAQQVTEYLGVVVVMDNSVDRRHGRGLAATVDMAKVRMEIQTALMGWEPLSRPTAPMRYVGSEHMGMSDARIYHMFNYSIKYIEGPKDPDADPIPTLIYGRYKGWEPQFLLDSEFDPDKHEIISEAILDVLVTDSGAPMRALDPKVFFKPGYSLSQKPSPQGIGQEFKDE